MIGACPNPSRACPYYGARPRGPLRREQSHGCFSDTDHKIPQRLVKRVAETALAREIINDPDNLQQLCRWEHDEKTAHENDRLLLRALTARIEQRLEEGPDVA